MLHLHTKNKNELVGFKLVKTAILYIVFFHFSILNAEIINIEPLSNILKSTDKQTYEKIQELQNIIKESVDKKGDIIYCLISDSIEIEYLKKIIFEVTALSINTGTQVAFITRGIYTESIINKMEKLNKELGKYQYGEVFKKNVNFFVSPSLFTKFKINKVPVLLYGNYSVGIYPKNDSISYIARGDISILDFFKLISTKESRFEKYSNIISTLY